MRRSFNTIVLVAALFSVAPFATGQSLIENGKFENPGDPLKGWITDYEWTGNSYYIANKQHVSVVSEGARQSVAKMDSPGTQGVKMECRAFPFEPGFRYTCTLDVKGGEYRIYFAGYRWAPGVHPHENPELGELRMIYQSKAATGNASGWKREKIELPGVTKLSPTALEHLKDVRYLTVYIWFMKPGFVDDVTVTKVADQNMKF